MTYNETYNLVYNLIRKKGQKSLRMHFGKKGNLIISVPYFTPPRKIEEFISKNSEWIEKHKPSNMKKKSNFTCKELITYVRERVNFRCGEMGLEVPQIDFYNACSYWGICYHEKKLVKFTWRCCFLDEKTVDYIVVHELCHLVHHGHGPDFWEMVAKYCPDYKIIKRSIC